VFHLLSTSVLGLSIQCCRPVNSSGFTVGNLFSSHSGFWNGSYSSVLPPIFQMKSSGRSSHLGKCKVDRSGVGTYTPGQLINPGLFISIVPHDLVMSEQYP